MKTALAKRVKPYAINPNTFEVYARTPDKDWKQALADWIACRRARKCDYHASVVPSPMPFGHIMFRCTKDNFYKPCDEPPKPIWSDGVGCLYLGQRVGWIDVNNQWHWGIVKGLDLTHHNNPQTAADCALVIQSDCGQQWFVEPYNLA